MNYVTPTVITIGPQKWGRSTGFLSHGMMG